MSFNLKFKLSSFDNKGQKCLVGLEINTKGVLASVDAYEGARQSILLLLATSPGERLLRPLYGCDLQRLVFSPNDDTTAGLAIHYVKQAITKFEPEIEIINLDASADPDAPERLLIILDYRLKGDMNRETLTIPLDLNGEG